VRGVLGNRYPYRDPDQYRFGDHAAESARPCQPSHDDNQMHQKDQELPHLGNRIKLQQTLGFARVLGIRHEQARVLKTCGWLTFFGKVRRSKCSPRMSKHAARKSSQERPSDRLGGVLPLRVTPSMEDERAFSHPDWPPPCALASALPGLLRQPPAVHQNDQDTGTQQRDPQQHGWTAFRHQSYADDSFTRGAQVWARNAPIAERARRDTPRRRNCTTGCLPNGTGLSKDSSQI